MNTVPNMDAMNKSELWEFWKVYREGRARNKCALLIGDRRKNYTVYAANLANYACNKAVAMDCRERGDIRAALVYESICDGIYSILPDDLKW